MESEIMFQNADFKEIRVTFPYNSSFIKKTIDGRKCILKRILLLRLKTKKRPRITCCSEQRRNLKSTF